MKLKKIQTKLAALLNADQRAQIKQASAIKELLGKLKKKERHLKEKLEVCDDEAQRKKLETRLNICHAQRLKGLTLLKEIKAAKQAAS
jgi:hypothetical protein